MCPARDHDQPVRVGLAGRDEPRFRGTSRTAGRHGLFIGVARPVAEEHALLGGRIDNAGDGPTVFDERDVDRELAVLVDEFLGPVERVDEKEAMPELRNVSSGGRLFGYDGNFRHGLPQA